MLGRDLVEKVKSLIHEGNVRRIIIRDTQGNTFMEISVTVAAVGAVLAPVLAAVGAISALAAKFTIVVVWTQEPQRPELKSDRIHASFGLFLLPGGLPRRLTAVIQAGGLPRRLPRPDARRSNVRMACSMFSRSARSSASIMSILAGYRVFKPGF